MTGKNCSVAIINRSFWPASQVLGEAHLRVAERLALNSKVIVITQSAFNLKAEMSRAGRGKNVVVCASKAFSNSATNLVLRILDALFFTSWVFLTLCWHRPKKVYVSTDPPIVVPFVVSIYCLASRSRALYHLQDIHPEAANIIVPMHPLVFLPLRAIDSWSMRRASQIVTLSEDMAAVIRERSNTGASVRLLDNPAAATQTKDTSSTRGFIYCGNAGRLQRIPLLLEAISRYREQGGTLPFEFVGGGVYSQQIADLATRDARVYYLGFVSADKAAERVAAYEWAILSIEDDVTRYAFPSKSSTYAVAGTRVLAICGSQTSVAKWVLTLGIGRVCEPNVDDIVAEFFAIEKEDKGNPLESGHADITKLRMDYFVDRLCSMMLAT